MWKLDYTNNHVSLTKVTLGLHAGSTPSGAGGSCGPLMLYLPHPQLHWQKSLIHYLTSQTMSYATRLPYLLSSHILTFSKSLLPYKSITSIHSSNPIPINYSSNQSVKVSVKAFGYLWSSTNLPQKLGTIIIGQSMMKTSILPSNSAMMRSWPSGSHLLSVLT